VTFPASGWPPRPASSSRSIRFFKTGTTTANWSDNAFLFIDTVGANTYIPTPVLAPGSLAVVAVGVRNSVGVAGAAGSPMGAGQSSLDVLPGETGQMKALIWSNSIRVCNDGAGVVEFSFAAPDDGSTLVHGSLKAGEQVIYRQRIEAGIALRFPSGSSGGVYRVEAW
jgi:hypothetical protein